MATLQRLHIRGLRNLAPSELSIHQQLLLVTGDNGSGKTALLEAIALLATGRSFRESRLQRCQQWQAPQLTLYAELTNRQGTHRLGWQRDKQQIQLRLNGDHASNQALLAQQLPVQIFSPESHDLLTQGPNERRRFLDWGVFYQESQFLQSWRNYQHALKQRNHALKQQRPSAEIRLWHTPLYQAAHHIHQCRQHYVDALAQQAQLIMAQLSDALINIQLSYYAGWDTQQDLAHLWEEQLAHERQLGFTQAGPHRADLKLRLHDRDALSVLSRGQQKLLALALMLAQAQLFNQYSQESPILLLDDLAAELDLVHRERLLTYLPSLNAQCIFTATHAHSLPLTPQQHWHLTQGNIEIRPC